MTHRERVLRTLRFEPTDRVPCDLMESVVWPELMAYFRDVRGLADEHQVHDYLDTDFRWAWPVYQGPAQQPPAEGLPPDWYATYSDRLYPRRLAHAETVAEVEAAPWPDSRWWVAPDFAALRQRWPNHALVYSPGWMPLFCGACDAFGMENALVKMIAQPDVFEAFVARQHAFTMELIGRTVPEAARWSDVCELLDDYATQDALIMSPSLWRKLIKPYLAEQVSFVRSHGLFVLFHSCGSIRSILPDLVDIGISAHLVFQTSAAGMDAPSIARDFGGRIAFYGGVDCQHLLTFGSPEDVAAAVVANVRAFNHCGGYIVANAHHCIPLIRGENIEAMCRAAHESGPITGGGRVQPRR